MNHQITLAFIWIFLGTCLSENQIKSLAICTGIPTTIGDPSAAFQRDTFDTATIAENRSIVIDSKVLEEDAVRCGLDITACQKCVIAISWKRVLIIDNLGFDPLKIQCLLNNKQKECADVFLEEDAAEEIPTRKSRPYLQHNLLTMLSNQDHVVSTGYKVTVRLVFHQPPKELTAFLRDFFPLNLTVLDNTEVRKGRPETRDITSAAFSFGYIASPRFPFAYPDHVLKNYTLVNLDESGLVRLIFSDFNVHYMSELKILDSDGTEIVNTQGHSQDGRPLPIQSTGPVLTLLFSAKLYTQMIGFRAKYVFVNRGEWEDRPKARTSSEAKFSECDNRLTAFGGFIDIPSQNLDVNGYVDCVWIIRKERYNTEFYNKLYLKVENFSVKSNSKGIHLEIREGLNSLSNPKIFDAWGAKSPEELEGLQKGGFEIDLEEYGKEPSGYYIRLQGYLGSYAGLKIVYAQFYKWATAMCNDEKSEFHCGNSRCIRATLKCDKANHCGDNSDELPEACGGTGTYGGYPGGGQKEPGFRGESHSPFDSSGMIFLVAGLIGLTLVMLMITVVVARVYRQRLIRRLTREANQAASIRDSASQESGSRNAPQIQRVGDRRFFVVPETDVQMFEAPPTYDDALKHPSVPPNNPQEIPLNLRQPPSSHHRIRPVSAGVTSTAFTEEPSEPGPSFRHSAPPISEAPVVIPARARISVSSASSSGDSSDCEIAPDPVCSDSEYSIDSSVGPSSSSTVANPATEPSTDTKRGGTTLSGIIKWAKHKVSSKPESVYNINPAVITEEEEKPDDDEETENPPVNPVTSTVEEEPKPIIVKISPRDNKPVPKPRSSVIIGPRITDSIPPRTPRDTASPRETASPRGHSSTTVSPRTEAPPTPPHRTSPETTRVAQESSSNTTPQPRDNNDDDDTYLESQV